MSTDPIATARGLQPLILEQRDNTETLRRIAQPIVDALIDTRLARSFIAAEHGGTELHPVTSLEIFETLAYAEASVGWIVWNNALPAMLSRFLPAEGRNEVYADPTWLYGSSTRPSGTATPAEDGITVSGRWSLVSGCELCEWLVLTCTMGDGMAQAFVRKGQFQILDTWHVGGLRGTGSHDVVVEDLWVPAKCTFVPPAESTIPSPIGQMPITCTMGAGLAAQIIGIATSAIDTAVELARSKRSPEPSAQMGTRPATHLAIANHRAAVGAARQHLHSQIDTLWHHSADPSLERIASVWSAALNAMRVATAAVEDMYAAAGSSAIYNTCPLERIHRDLHAMLRHVVAQDQWLEDAGRVHLGQAPVNPLFAF